MKRGWLAALGLLFTCYSAFAEYALFYENGKAGIRDEAGKVILPAAYDELGWSDGRFSVINQVTGYRQQNKWGLLNLRKEFVTPAEFESLTTTGGDRIVAVRQINPFTNKFGCLDLNGKTTVPFHYDGITILGLRAIVFQKNGTRYTYGLIDLNNNRVLAPEYSEIRPIGSLRFMVKNMNGKSALFTEEGVRLTEFAIDSISGFHRGNAIFYQGFTQGLLDREGNIKAQPVYRELKIDEQGIISGRLEDEWKILDPSNTEIMRMAADVLIPDGDQYITMTMRKYGTVDQNLTQRVPQQYDKLSPFVNNLSVITIMGKYGIINKRGKFIFTAEHDSLSIENNFVRSMKLVMGEKQWSVYDTFGIRKTEKVYDNILPYNGRFFPVRRYGFWGGVDRYGKENIKCVYDEIVDFNSQIVVVKFKKMYGIIDLEEKWLVMPQPFPLTLVNDRLYIEKQDSVNMLKNTEGEIIYFTGRSLQVAKDHLEELTELGEIKQVSFEGISSLPAARPVIDGTERIFEESEGMRKIERDGRYGFIDNRGRLRIANRYENAGRFREGLAPVMILNKWGFVNKQDNIVINPSYEAADEFEEGLSITKRNGLFGIIDATGNEILPFRYDSIERVDTKLLIWQNQQVGLADHEGHVLIDPRFDMINVLPNMLVIVRDGNRWAVLTHQGMTVIPMIYDYITFNEVTGQFLTNRKSPWKKLILP